MLQQMPCSPHGSASIAQEQLATPAGESAAAACDCEAICLPVCLHFHPQLLQGCCHVPHIFAVLHAECGQLRADLKA